MLFKLDGNAWRQNVYVEIELWVANLHDQIRLDYQVKFYLLSLGQRRPNLI